MATKMKKIAKSLKIFFSETRRHRALIFGMQHLLVDLYQDCSYDVPGVKTGPAPGVGGFGSQFRNIGTKKENFKILLL